MASCNRMFLFCGRYRHLISRLSGSFRTIAWDRPGFGLSTAPEGYGFRPEDHARIAAGLIDALDLREITVMTQDWGGPIALDAALTDPSRIKQKEAPDEIAAADALSTSCGSR